ncbi:dTMP kinase [Sphaerochaeta sp. PS]|uniref:dTMP kinase n=1 Tax=Sphaerochaeta sp. PS TaxID=3076336 RepID=UPI0028A3AF9C|nr:dTMP kinase [Sphaerochaeta sp. PS]MDT4761489.1 dTMP kinase [Sphaerochaeta sp. PS]
MSSILENLIVFEGLDGAGTTTQMQLLAEYCDKNLRSCKATFEPTDKPIGRLVRAILKKQVVTTPLALAMLYAADREDHLYNPVYGLVNDLEEGKLVICDRYLYSSLAYQGVECPLEKVEQLNQFPAPNYLFFIDTPVTECIRRIALRGDEAELFDRAEFLESVRNNYETLFSDLPKDVKFYRLDGLKSIEEIALEIQGILF